MTALEEYPPGDIKFQATMIIAGYEYTGQMTKTREKINAPKMSDVKNTPKQRMYWNHSQAIIEVTCRAFDLEPNHVFSKSRLRKYVRVRSMVYHLIRSRTNLSLPQIGRIFKKDHTTILHGLKNFKKDTWGDAHKADQINNEIDEMYRAFMASPREINKSCPPCHGEVVE